MGSPGQCCAVNRPCSPARALNEVCKAHADMSADTCTHLQGDACTPVRLGVPVSLPSQARPRGSSEQEGPSQQPALQEGQRPHPFLLPLVPDPVTLVEASLHIPPRSWSGKFKIKTQSKTKRKGKRRSHQKVWVGLGAGAAFRARLTPGSSCRVSRGELQKASRAGQPCPHSALDRVAQPAEERPASTPRPPSLR